VLDKKAVASSLRARAGERDRSRTQLGYGLDLANFQPNDADGNETDSKSRCRMFHLSVNYFFNGESEKGPWLLLPIAVNRALKGAQARNLAQQKPTLCYQGGFLLLSWVGRKDYAADALAPMPWPTSTASA